MSRRYIYIQNTFCLFRKKEISRFVEDNPWYQQIWLSKMKKKRMMHLIRYVNQLSRFLFLQLQIWYDGGTDPYICVRELLLCIASRLYCVRIQDWFPLSRFTELLDTPLFCFDEETICKRIQHKNQHPIYFNNVVLHRIIRFCEIFIVLSIVDGHRKEQRIKKSHIKNINDKIKTSIVVWCLCHFKSTYTIVSTNRKHIYHYMLPEHFRIWNQQERDLKLNVPIVQQGLQQDVVLSDIDE